MDVSCLYAIDKGLHGQNILQSVAIDYLYAHQNHLTNMATINPLRLPTCSRLSLKILISGCKIWSQKLELVDTVCYQ